jgi:hypothetical protein
MDAITPLAEARFRHGERHSVEGVDAPPAFPETRAGILWVQRKSGQPT